MMSLHMHCPCSSNSVKNQSCLVLYRFLPPKIADPGAAPIWAAPQTRPSGGCWGRHQPQREVRACQQVEAVRRVRSSSRELEDVAAQCVPDGGGCTGHGSTIRYDHGRPGGVRRGRALHTGHTSAPARPGASALHAPALLHWCNGSAATASSSRLQRRRSRVAASRAMSLQRAPRSLRRQRCAQRLTAAFCVCCVLPRCRRRGGHRA
jgi:hypothetical protein